VLNGTVPTFKNKRQRWLSFILRFALGAAIAFLARFAMDYLGNTFPDYRKVIEGVFTIFAVIVWSLLVIPVTFPAFKKW
jgi:cytochrome c biogenesis protein CcdA